MLVNLNNLNIYIKDIVAMFKLFARAYSLMKNFHTTNYVATQALRSRIYIFAFALVIY